MVGRPKDAKEEYYEQIAGFAQTEEKKAVENRTGILDGTYLFISIDLVNSTLLKNRFPKRWTAVISQFYEAVKKVFGVTTGVLQKCDQVDESFEPEALKSGFHVWKYIGDEVLLYHKVVSDSELYNCVQYTYSMLDKIIDETRLGMNQPTTSEDSEEFRSLVDAKGCMWIACCQADKVGDDVKNMIYQQTLTEGTRSFFTQTFDFIGPDIDEGFRLCKYSERRRLVVSPQLVGVLLRCFQANKDRSRSIKSNFRIMMYENLKGVWGERLYPIILFGYEFGTIRKLMDEAQYDEFMSSKLFSNAVRAGIESYLGDEQNGVSRLDKIFRDMGKEKEIEQLETSIKAQKKEFAVVKVNANRGAYVSVQISCLCYARVEEDYKFLIEKHENFGWNFGHAKLSGHEELISQVIRRYREKYRLDIVLNTLDALEPLEIYTVEKENRRSLGIVVLAEIADPDLLLNELESAATDSGMNTCEGHRPCMRLVTREEAAQLSQAGSEKCIKNLLEDIEKGYERIRQRHAG